MREAEAGESLSEDLATARNAVLEAGTLAMDFKHRGVKVWDKAPGDPVTDADIAVNTLLATRLRDARPDYGWLSEESVPEKDIRSSKRIWLVDPIDGTRAYMRDDDPHWCIGVAVVENGKAVAGIIYAPELDALYEARLGGGAYLNGELLQASQVRTEEGCRLITNKGLVQHPAWREPWPDVIVADPKPNATLLRLAFIADGTWDAALVLFRKSDWDLAAGAILIQEAGGEATTHLGEPFLFNGPVPAQRSVIAAGKHLHPLLVRRTQMVALPNPGEAA
ncbi:MAG: 3'(2'),5'-bisphosphate nucleotidase CysQ [Pseudomonadota bacterium]